MASGSGDEEGSTGGVSWRLIGPASELSKKRCRLMYSSLGNDCDVCLFFVKGEFFAMDARCSHSGGPLCEGDIEEADGVLQVFCPWHDYNFDLRTGRSGTSLQQQVYEVKLVDGSVYVKHRRPKPEQFHVFFLLLAYEMEKRAHALNMENQQSVAAFYFIIGQNPVDLNIVYLSSQTLLLRLVALERNRKS